MRLPRALASYRLLSCVVVGALLSTSVQAQAGKAPKAPRTKPRHVLWYTPSMASHIHGISLGMLGSEVVCNAGTPQVGNGIKVEVVSNAIFLLMLPRTARFRTTLDSLHAASDEGPTTRMITDRLALERGRQNGVVVSVLGSQTDVVNGLALDGLVGVHTRMRGVLISGLANIVLDHAGIQVSPVNNGLRVRGLQIGLINRTHDLRGLAIAALAELGNGRVSHPTEKERGP